MISKYVMGISKKLGAQWYSPYCMYPQKGFPIYRRPLYTGMWSGLTSRQLSYNNPSWCCCSHLHVFEQSNVEVLDKRCSTSAFCDASLLIVGDMLKRMCFGPFLSDRLLGLARCRILLRLLVVAARAVCTLPVGCFSEASQGLVQVASVL